jgi:MoaA/NifB/PqqE/SkfB family radical SAM enzyme
VSAQDPSRPPGGRDRHIPGAAHGPDPDLVTNDNFPHTAAELYHIQIGVTYACQCRCRHCGVSDQGKRSGMLTPEEIVEVCRQAQTDLGARVVELFGGEPLIHPRILDIVAGTARYLDVWMSSNALGFTPETARALAERGLKRCFFSLDAPTAAAHDANRNHAGSFDAVMRALDLAHAVGIDANLSTCAMATLVNSEALEDLIALTKSKARKLRLVLPKMSGRLANDESVLLNADEIERIRKVTAKDAVAYVEAEGNYAQRIEKCFCLRGHVYINPYGVMQPCVYTPLNFGNVRDAPLAELYARMFNHRVFADKSLLNLCLLQNPEFVRTHLANVSRARPLIDIAFD